MKQLSFYNNLLDHNFSLMPIGEEKIPWIRWKEYQSKKIDKTQFEKYYNNNKTKGIGIITGFEGLEVIDVDLKVLPTLKEQADFWNDLKTFLSDNIPEFEEKFVIYKTVNNGYHILYRCSKIEGNKKLAKLEGHEQAIIETRGLGGYVFIYDKKVSEKDYLQIQEISELERDILISVCKTYNFEETKSKRSEEFKTEPKEYRESKLTPWEDYNNKTSIFDLISDDFKIVRQLSDKFIIKRNNANSMHSGYIYKDSGCMYLFSTGTIYPNEELITPFKAFTIKYYNSNFSKAASELYSRGFGERKREVVYDFKESKEEIKKEYVEFPLGIFPESIQHYISTCNSTLNSSVDYLGCSFMWLASMIIGNSFKVEVKNGWYESAVLWLILVGKAGIGKTPSIDNIIFPLNKINSFLIKKYIKDVEKYQYYQGLDKKEKMQHEEVRKPINEQFLVNDITIEALIQLHSTNDNGIGVFKDELAGWIKDMNKYRAGSDLEHWLSSWSGKSIFFNRKSVESDFVQKPFMPVLGGIQPTIFDSFYTNDNKDSGFIDRMLMSYPDLKVDKYNTNEMPTGLLDWYENEVIRFFHNIKNNFLNYSREGDLLHNVVKFSDDSKIEWERIFNKITTAQNSMHESEYLKSMYPKQKSYIPRFALILNMIWFHFEGSDHTIITKESILRAEKLSDYFVNMAKKVKIEGDESKDIEKSLKNNDNKNLPEKIIQLYNENTSVNKTKLAEKLSVSRQYVHNVIKKHEESKCKQSVNKV